MLVKGRKLPAMQGEDGRPLSDREDEEEEDGEAIRAARQRTLPEARPQAGQVSPELSALVVYCCATRLKTLHPGPGPAQPYQVGSLSERRARKLLWEAGRNWALGTVGTRCGGDSVERGVG